MLTVDDGTAVEWPSIGYDDPSVHMMLFIDGLLAAILLITVLLIYHWSCKETNSAAGLHGAKDEKFQMNVSKKMLKASKAAAEEEKECTS